jgi:eukaryotic-like serine/threonine-protein kinase
MPSREYVGRYKVTGLLPAGRALEAYQAVDPAGTPVTVKLLAPLDRERFFAQMRDLAAVRHEHVARVLEWGVEGGLCFVVTEALAGTDLATLAGRDPGLAPSVVAELGAQAAAALAALHGRGILHGGVTPLAMVRTQDGVLKLTDAGIAVASGQADLSDMDPAQNAYFVSPEEVLARDLTPSSDVYSLGASLYAIATGTVPFDGPNAMVVAERHAGSAPEAPRQLRPDLPASLEHAILRAMAKQPEQRHGSAEELRQDLERAAAGMRVAPPAAAPFTPQKPKRPVWPWIVGLALVAAVVALLWFTGAFGGNVTVPDLDGMTLDEARRTLTDVGLELGDLTTGESQTGVPEGTVVGQSPDAGGDVDEGSAVDLVVAGAPNVVMPDLAGLSQAEAEAAVTAAGLIVERVTTVYSNDVPAGKVADQTPSAGTTVPQGTPVTLTLSAGPQTSPSPGADAVPDVTGMTQAEALTALEEGGFSAVITTEASETVPAGEVINQNPKGGVLAAPGTSVTLVVSSGTASP